ncbi:hypothetical protein OG417_46825 [Actinoallomurus sp. NBC_01490]|uniref:hypothetical protein n=1 Tax=Actinoallomurus sp. NBC_01490 TaxID=2903557 RepID=UPI002E30CD76|nr:hypothetical protein [Actinoallomurus sp. NBC_01490]
MNVDRKVLLPVSTAALALAAAGFAGAGLAGDGGEHAAVHAGAAPAAATSAVAPHKCGKTPSKNLHLSRTTILKRGKSWVTAKVPYSQTGTPYCNSYGRYRRDCSGFVSMAWGLHTSYWTGSLLGVSKKVSNVKKVAKGDALTHYPKSSARGHVALVVSKGEKGVYVYAEPRTGSYAQKQYWSWKYIKSNHYYGIRYKNVK